MNLKDVKEMIKLMNDNGLTELEIEREGIKIKLRKTTQDMLEPVRVQPTQYVVEADRPPTLVGNLSLSDQEKANENTKMIVSPMVGTFYRAPSPESEPFIEVGQIVEIGQVVCIIEAMKLMNEIKSEVRGKIVEVAVENAEPVEFGQSLFRVDPV